MILRSDSGIRFLLDQTHFLQGKLSEYFRSYKSQAGLFSRRPVGSGISECFIYSPTMTSLASLLLKYTYSMYLYIESLIRECTKEDISYEVELVSTGLHEF